MAELISEGEFATEGERKAAKKLQELPNSWLIICNKTLSTRDNRSFEMDFIVVGKRWVFLLDEKSWRGRIRGNETLWSRENGSSEKSPLNKIDYVAKVLAGHLRDKIYDLNSNENTYFVRSGILFTTQEQLPQIHDIRAAEGIFLLDDVCQRLQYLDNKGGNPVVGKIHNHIRKHLVDLSARSLVPSQINLFTIQDSINLRPGVRRFNAILDNNPEDPRQLMVYDLGSTSLDIQTKKDFYLREFKTLKKLHATGLVPDIDSPFEWSDNFLILPIIPPPGQSLYVNPLPETQEEFLQDLQLAAICFKALDQIHANDIIHRAISPDAIYVSGGSAPKIIFTNFYAARVEEINTISVELDQQMAQMAVEDPYIAIEQAIGYGHASTETDTFSLALVFLERFSGVPITTIRANVNQEIIFPDKPRWNSFLPNKLAEELAQLLQQALGLQKNVACPTAKVIGQSFNEIVKSFKTAVKGEEPLYFINKQFQLIRLLGEGAMARTYLVSRTEYETFDPRVLKQFKRPEEVFEQVKSEYRALDKINSPYLPRIYDIYGPQSDAHIQMEYIPGSTLQEVENEFPWPLDRWWNFTQGLLKALDLLEQHHILHRDIKPANIILHQIDSHPVLIDFGFAMREGDRAKFAGTPRYLPPETLKELQTSPDCDRYASAIVLFQALTGQLPFLSSTTGIRQPIDLSSLKIIEDVKVKHIIQILQKAASPSPEKRYASANELREELASAMLAVDEPAISATLQELSNPWVDDIRSLYRNSEIGNANNRGLETEFVRVTYVHTALDEKLLPAIITSKPKVVFLSGNPGDGKTAFLEQVLQELQHLQAHEISRDASGWEMHYQGHIFRSCYDASESHQNLSADEQLIVKLSGIEGKQTPDQAITVLVAINDGRLADFLEKHQDQFQWLWKQTKLIRNKEELTESDVWLIDLKKRAFVQLPKMRTPSIFLKVINSLVVDEQWKKCEGCAAQNICPIRHNALALQNKRIAKRLEFLFLLTHLRRQRHVTMRDLRSSLSYVITGNQGCAEIHQLRQRTDAGASLINFAYWQSSFDPIDKSEELLTELAALDPARYPQPHLDRFLHFHQSSRDASLREQLYYDQQDLAPQRFKGEYDWIAATKRRLYFEGTRATSETIPAGLPKLRWQQLLPYKFATTFVKLLEGDKDSQVILEQLALGLLRSDGIMEQVPEKKLSIKVSASDEQQLVILKQLPLEKFQLSIAFPRGTDMVEALPEIVTLQHNSGTPSLTINLDLFDLLLKLADGQQPTAPEYQPLLEDLSLFKSTLLLQETKDLVLIENRRNIHYITQRNGKIVRQTW